MIATQHFYRKRSFWLIVILLSFFAVFIYLFQNEVCAFFYNRPCGPDGSQVPNRATGFRVILQFSIIFISSLLVCLFIVSQFVLPVQTSSERMRVFSRFLLYFLNRHGPAIFVHEGKQKVRTEEMQSSRPGVAFVDPCSAIVLEKQWKPRRRIPKARPLPHLFNRNRYQPEKITIAEPLARAAGPGIVYTRNSERVIGVTDLRKQFRINTDVLAYTADGLEMKAHVYAIFCLGLPPEVLKVAYIDGIDENLCKEKEKWKKLAEEQGGSLTKEQRAEQKKEREKLDNEMCKKLRVVYIDWKWDETQKRSVEYIKDIKDELDMEDRSPDRDQVFIDRGEVHRYALIKAEMKDFLDDTAPLSEDILRRWVTDLKPRGQKVILEFLATLYENNREVLYRIFDQLMPINLPEAGIFRFAFNKTILHQIIDEFESYLPKGQLQSKKLRNSEKKILHGFIDRLFTQYRRPLAQRYAQIDQETGKPLKLIIDMFAQKFWMNLEHPTPPKAEQFPPVVSPFIFDAERVFHAVYARGRNPENNIPIRSDDWMKQPTQIATELYRQELSQIKYDDLYLPHIPNHYPLADEVKPRFARIMQNSGVLSYQLIRRMDGKKIEKGQVVDSNEFNLNYPIMEFRQPKSLRERGIRVIYAGFTELAPVTTEKDVLGEAFSSTRPAEQPYNPPLQTPGSLIEAQSDQSLTSWSPNLEKPASSIPIVRKQRFDTWQAQWQKESELIKAESELELMHIRNRARAQAQQDMTLALSQILETANSKEAIAMRIFQALEAAATDPSTHQLLPHETLEILRSLRQWLLPGGDEGGKPPEGSSSTFANRTEGQG